MSLEDDSLNGTSVVIEDRLSVDKKKPLLAVDRVRQFLKDSKSHSMKEIQKGCDITSQGAIFNILQRLLGYDEIEVTFCEHCDSITKLYKLK
jgi:hypothetical protein